MKRNIFLLAMFLGVLNYSAFSQTKEETVAWLKYNLNKYYGDNYDLSKRLNTTKNKLPYYWNSRQYIFEADKLNITTFRYEIDTSGNQEVIGEVTETINLKRIIKVENILNADISGGGNVTIKLIFKDPEYDNERNVVEHGVTTYDEILKKDVTMKKSYFLAYNLTSYVEETVNSKTEQSFTKAFSHLAELSGAKIIKDIF